jgi:non-specific protein-tyrosine kinase
VVSALPGEGVSTVSSVFASVLSLDSQSAICRVDLSWASSSHPGVYEVVMGERELDEVLVWSGTFATLPCGGGSVAERHQLARSEGLDKLIATLASRFQHVVLDVPAILTGSDGLAMMRLVDAYVLVVKHGVTTLQQVQTATAQLESVPQLGSVLNQARIRTPRPLSRWLAG